MALRLKSYFVAPRLGRIALRSSSIFVAVTVMPAIGWAEAAGACGGVCAATGTAQENRPHTTAEPPICQRIGSLPTDRSNKRML